MQKINIMAVDDYEFIRNAYKNEFSKTESIQYYKLLGVYDDSKELFFALKQSKELPDIILLDYELIGETAPEIISKIKQAPQYEHINIIVVSHFRDYKYVIETAEADASGYVIKNNFEEIKKAIHIIHNNNYEYFLGEKIEKSDILFQKTTKKNKLKRKLKFKDKDILILQHLKEGRKTKDIAEILFCSPKTIESRIAKMKANIYQLTNEQIKPNISLIVFALKNELISL